MFYYFTLFILIILVFFQADVMEFKPQYAVQNGGKKYLLVMVNTSTGKLWAIALARKTQASWEGAFRKMLIENFPECLSVTTDRDVAISSPAWQSRMKKELQVSFFTMPARGKAQRAERMIRWHHLCHMVLRFH